MWDISRVWSLLIKLNIVCSLRMYRQHIVCCAFGHAEIRMADSRSSSFLIEERESERERNVKRRLVGLYPKINPLLYSLSSPRFTMIYVENYIKRNVLSLLGNIFEISGTWLCMYVYFEHGERIGDWMRWAHHWIWLHCPLVLIMGGCFGMENDVDVYFIEWTQMLDLWIRWNSTN